MISDRVKRLRQQSVDTRPFITAERAELITDFFASDRPEGLSIQLQRANAFKFLLKNKSVYIGPGELIVGERGPRPRATPTYPELCCHTIHDLEVVNTRERSGFDVDKATFETYRERIIPFWKGRSMRESIFSEMSDDWMNAFDAGIFTEFMEQRAPGHAIMDNKIYHKGLRGFIEDIHRSLEQLDFQSDSDARRKEQELLAMEMSAQALIDYANRHAEKALVMASKERNNRRRKELEQIAQICSHVPANPPRSFWEALQMYWFIHLGVIIELNVWDSFSPGRLDLNLYPFYREGISSGKLSRDFAKELLQCFWVKFNNQPAPPKVGITEEQSGTYQDFSLINTGGLTKEGHDAVNELSRLILEVCNEMRLIQPSVCIQLSKKTDDSFLMDAINVIKEGFGQPSIFNTDVIFEEFLRAGKTSEDARSGGPSGCVTISAFGKESCILTGYCNWPKILELTLNNGIDPRTGLQVGLKTGDPMLFETYSDLEDAFERQLQYFVNLKIEGNNKIEQLYAHKMPTPFLSLLIDDCISKGLDYHEGGARYNSTYIQGVGMGTVTDSLSAIKHHVFDAHNMTMKELLEAVRNNFENSGFIRSQLLNKTPTYGNDDDYADAIAKEVFNAYFDAIDNRPNMKGGEYRVNLLPTTVHIYFGHVTGATPNGRKEGEPLSDGVSPSHGADHNGPTAVIKSVAKIDHTKTGGTLLNQKFLPNVFQNTEGRRKIGDLVKTYFKLGGHHIQFNVVDERTLREAQRHPERHRNLIVRVAGYSDYFVDIGRDLQDEIIARTSHGRV